MAESSPVIQIILQRSTGDCALVALAMFLGRSYEDVLAVAGSLDEQVHRHGLYIPQILKIAKRLGTPLCRRKHWDLETSEGILDLASTINADAHVVVLKAGLIFDTEGTVWSPEVYLLNEYYKPMSLLERK